MTSFCEQQTQTTKREYIWMFIKLHYSGTFTIEIYTNIHTLNIDANARKAWRERERERERSDACCMQMIWFCCLTQHGLQLNLDLLEQHCKTWALTVTLKKTNIIIFQKRSRSQGTQHTFTLGTNFYAIKQQCPLEIPTKICLKILESVIEPVALILHVQYTTQQIMHAGPN